MVPLAGGNRPVHDLAYYNSVVARLSANAFVEHPVSHLTAQDLDAEEAFALLPLPTVAFAVNNKTNMLGVMIEDVLAAMTAGLVAARESGNIVPFVQDMVLGMNLGVTISRAHVQQYRSLAQGSIFRAFEIKGRTPDPTQGAVGQWVAGCDMNASAVRLCGMILLCWVPAPVPNTPKSFLTAVAERTGTLFNPPIAAAPIPGAPPMPPTRASLLRAAAETMTPVERDLINQGRVQFGKTIRLLERIYGGAGGNFLAALAAAAAMPAHEI